MASTRLQLLKLSKPELIRLCKSNKLKTNGNKKEIVDRLLNSGKNIQNPIKVKTKKKLNKKPTEVDDDELSIQQLIDKYTLKELSIETLIEVNWDLNDEKLKKKLSKLSIPQLINICKFKKLPTKDYGWRNEIISDLIKLNNTSKLRKMPLLKDKAELIVFGYCRYFKYLPDDIKYYCLNYYFLGEHFAFNGSNIKLNESKDIMKYENNTKNELEVMDTLCYGYFIIDPNDKLWNEYGSIKWTFKILNGAMFDNECFIGIMNVITHSFYGFRSTKCGLYHSFMIPFLNGAILAPDGDKWDKYDTVQIIFDIHKRKLVYIYIG